MRALDLVLLATLATLAAAGCRRDPAAEADLRAAVTGRWQHVDPERPGQREELDLLPGDVCEYRLFRGAAARPLLSTRGTWRIERSDIQMKGCQPGDGARRPRLEKDGSMSFLGEDTFVYTRRR